MLNLQKYAQLLVEFEVDVQKGDKVLITGTAESIPLIRAVYKEVLTHGGHPLQPFIEFSDMHEPRIDRHGLQDFITYRVILQNKHLNFFERSLSQGHSAIRPNTVKSNIQMHEIGNKWRPGQGDSSFITYIIFPHV